MRSFVRLKALSRGVENGFCDLKLSLEQIMRIEHVALWADDIERSREFYCKYFGAVSNEKYVNAVKGFESYFLSFESGARLEIMRKSGMAAAPSMSHIAFSAGSEEAVDALTEKLRNDGYEIAGEPRTTGDGYYESVILDPEGNIIEITV